MTDFTIEAIRDRAHLSPARRDCRCLPSADADVRHLLVEVKEWRPIETAPKDNVNVLIGAFDNGEWRCTVASYLYGETQMADMGRLPPAPRPITRGASWSLAAWGTYADSGAVDFDPTHWTYSPDPPEPAP